MDADSSAESTQNVSAQTQKLIILNQAFLHLKFKAKSTCKYLHLFLSKSKKIYISMLILASLIISMAIRVVEFSNGVYKIRKVFA